MCLADTEEVNEEAKDEVKPGYSFTPSAIEDLPSEAVQSIFIETNKPVELDAQIFEWREKDSRGGKTRASKKEGSTGKSGMSSRVMAKGKQKMKIPKRSKLKGGGKSQLTAQQSKKAPFPSSQIAKKKAVSAKSATKKPTSSQSIKVVPADSARYVKDRRPSTSTGNSQFKAAQGGKLQSKTQITKTRSKVAKLTSKKPKSSDK